MHMDLTDTARARLHAMRISSVDSVIVLLSRELLRPTQAHGLDLGEPAMQGDAFDTRNQCAGTDMKKHFGLLSRFQVTAFSLSWKASDSSVMGVNVLDSHSPRTAWSSTVRIVGKVWSDEPACACTCTFLHRMHHWVPSTITFRGTAESDRTSLDLFLASLQPDNMLLHQALQAQTASRQAQAELTDWSCSESGGLSNITTAEHTLLYAQVGSVPMICHHCECKQSDAEVVAGENQIGYLVGMHITCSSSWLDMWQRPILLYDMTINHFSNHDLWSALLTCLARGIAARDMGYPFWSCQSGKLRVWLSQWLT